MRSGSPLKLVIVGHVDHGKSTFVGRLLYETGAVPADRLEKIRAACERRGVPLEWAFLTDGLQAERDQNVTIETAHICFRTPRRGYLLMDAPGHREFLRNMITGATRADAAVLVVDATEGVKAQTRQHHCLLQLLGIRQILVLVNKMDLCEYGPDAFGRIAEAFPNHLVVPLSAREGDNIARKSARLAWYNGPTVLEALERFEAAEEPPDGPLRLPVQDIYRFDGRRIIVGRIESGTLRVGDRILFSPCEKRGTIKSLEGCSGSSAAAGESVGFTLAEPIFVERGMILSHEQEPPAVADRFRAKLFWLGRRKLEVGRSVKLRLATQETECHLESIGRIVDAETLAEVAGRSHLVRHDVAEVRIRTRRRIAFDAYDCVAATGRFVLVDEAIVCGGGIITDAEVDSRHRHLFWSETQVSRAERERRNRHKGTVIWLTGLPASGKSTIAAALERALFDRGVQTYVLDGDNIRHGLSANLGFSPEDRTENIRRVGEVAKLFCDAGLIVIVAFISPYREDRRLARSLVEEGDFIEVYVRAPLEVCERRDKKGLYRKARAGEIAEFTGVSAPYEPPEHPEIVLDTERHGPAECVDQILEFLQKNGRV